MAAAPAFSIVLAIKGSTHHDAASAAHDNIDRFLTVGIPSYERFLDRTGLAEFVVVAPAADLARLREELTASMPDWPWRFLDERVLIAKGIPGGWATQQMIKLAIAPVLKTDVYLIIDDDCFLVRPFGAADLWHGGRLVMTTMPAIDFPFFALWSARVLGMEGRFDEIQGFPYHMAITPEAFHRSVVLEIIAHLEGRHGKTRLGAGGGWQEHLATHKFTEYWIYWIYILLMGRARELYIEPGPGVPAMYAHVVSGPEHDLNTQVARAFDEATGPDGRARYFFSFVQTSQPYNNEQVRAAVLPRLAAAQGA